MTTLHPLTPETAIPGALVAYYPRLETEPDFGLVQSVRGYTVFVRYSHGDTAAGAEMSQLYLVVPVIRPQDFPAPGAPVDLVHELAGIIDSLDEHVFETEVARELRALAVRVVRDGLDRG